MTNMRMVVTHKSNKDEAVSDTSDLHLWSQLQSNDKQAYQKIYVNHIQALYHYGRKICNDSKLTEDCIQDLFVTIWVQKDRLTISTSIRFYLISSLRRMLLKAMKKSTTRKKMLTDFPYEVENNIESLNEDTQNTRAVKIKQVIATLPRRQREASDLKFFHNLDYEEISQIMEISVEAVYNHISKAVATLRKNISK